MTININSSDRAIDRGSEILACSNNELASFKNFESPQNIIFIHGFTAHGGYLQGMAHYFNHNDFNSFIFNYNSYLGIEHAAKSLLEMISTINDVGDGNIEKQKFLLVGHSMGGLVARA